MERLASAPRPNWQATVESQGFLFHTTEDGPYWNEEACYRFTSAEIDVLDVATNALNDLCLAAVEAVIQANRWDDFNIAPPYREMIRQSWENDELTVVGRFDLAFDGSGPPKLLEYNADTPTSLLEAAVIQWHWLKDLHGDADQFNSIHEKLIEAWQRVRTERIDKDRIHFSAVAGHLEDFMTVSYLRDTAMQAGLDSAYIDIEKIGWNPGRRAFVDGAERPILHAFKLYPWEWLMAEEFGPHLPAAPTQWLEAPWKVLLSNKAILAVLWEMFPNNEYLLPASLEPRDGDVVIKPRQAREGANVRIVRAGQSIAETSGTYDGPLVYQQYRPIRTFAGKTPVIGSWMVNGYACGIGIREDAGLVTGNCSQFVPHYFVP
jgi:glutathionylspermidine synthase